MNFITLEEWVAKTYVGDWKPSTITVRLWVKNGSISPAPEKHGRRLMFAPDARFVAKKKSLRQRISHGQAA